MRIKLKLALCLLPWFTCALSGTSTMVKTNGTLEDKSSSAYREAQQQRVQATFEALKGMPLQRAAIRAPLRPWRGNFSRHFSYALMEYATRCFWLGEQIEEANAALMENARHYLEHPRDIHDQDSFHWHAEVICRLIEFYGRHGSRNAGRMTPEVEAACMTILWEYAVYAHDSLDNDLDRTGTWHLYISENHHMQAAVLLWHVARLAQLNPEYSGRAYNDGTTPTEQYAAWTAYFKEYFAERARRGLMTEVGSENYNLILLKGVYNLFDFASDDALRNQAENFLHLFWAVWAQEQIDGVRGGGAVRVRPSGADRIGHHHLRDMAWYYFGIGDSDAPLRYESPYLTALTSGYCPPALVTELATDVRGRGEYEIRFRSPGRAEGDGYEPTTLRVRPSGTGIHGYTYCTPDFIMGTLMVDSRPVPDWVVISSQNRWQGAVFAGHPRARIFVQSRAAREGASYNAQWTVQSRGTMIIHKLKFNDWAAETRVWFSSPGLDNYIEEDGWVFVEAPHAYAAVRPVSGGYTWQLADDRIAQGRWLVCEDEWTPVILEVARKSDFKDFSEFRDAVAALPMEETLSVYSRRSLTVAYEGLGGDRFHLHTDYRLPPSINGVPVEYDLNMAYDSPFVRGAYGSGVIHLVKGDRRKTLDFNEASAAPGGQ